MTAYATTEQILKTMTLGEIEAEIAVCLKSYDKNMEKRNALQREEKSLWGTGVDVSYIERQLIALFESDKEVQKKHTELHNAKKQIELEIDHEIGEAIKSMKTHRQFARYFGEKVDFSSRKSAAAQ